MTTNREIEIKFKTESPRAIRKKLKEIGAKKLSRTFERNIYFDTKDGRLEKKGWLLRLRRDKENLLTLKWGRAPGKFKEMKEINLEIEDIKKMQKVLEQLGFYPAYVFEKIRETYKWKGVEILIDKLPYIGYWVEIEKIGKGKGDIEKTVKALGLKLSQGSNKSYMELYRDWCRKNKIKPRKKILL